MKNISEKRIVDVLVSFLRENSHVAREVRHYEKRIDVVAIPFDSDEITTYEAKMKDWKRAISQAIVNLTAGNRTYPASIFLWI